MDFRIDSADSVLYLCDTEVEEAGEDSDVKVHKDACKINDEESGAVEVLALFILFFYVLQIGDNWRVLL